VRRRILEYYQKTVNHIINLVWVQQNQNSKKENDGEFQLDSKGEKILKITKTAPCSNRPICCKLCKNMVIWSYNMSIHYAQTHPGIELPEFINKDEIKYVKNFKV
jgi:hypothetical protein